jgi:predicted lysophospholipase L1 biosynthesis ABC-type transport system permease subunit
MLKREDEAPLIFLLSIAGLVLLIACANLANLTLARAVVRDSEIGVRLSIGASRWRIVRQLMSESVLLALLASAAGITLAQIFSRYLLSSFAASHDPLFLKLSLDWRTVAFIASLATAACLLFGLLPALRATHRELSAAVRSSPRVHTGGRRQFHLQHALVIAQISLSLILLVGSFLFVRSFRKLVTLDPGFREQGLLIVWVGFDGEMLDSHPKTGSIATW